jgi:hypothetical protein
MKFYLLGFNRLAYQFSKRGANRYFWLSSVLGDELTVTMGEYCVANAAAEAYSQWMVKKSPSLRIACQRLPLLATDQTASFQGTDNGDAVLMLNYSVTSPN